MSIAWDRSNRALSAGASVPNVRGPSIGRRWPHGARRTDAHDAGSALTVAQLLACARAAGLARLDAQVLLAHHLSRERVWVIAHDDVAVPARSAELFLADVVVRNDPDPLARQMVRQQQDRKSVV